MPQYTFDDVAANYGVTTAEPKAVGLAAVHGSIDNILRTMPGERIFLPQFGSGLHELLFRPIDTRTARAIMERVRGAIRRWEPRVKLIEAHSRIIPDPDRNQYRVELTYEIRTTGQIGQYIGIVEAYTP